MSQSDVARHDCAGGDTKLACRKTIWLGTMSDVARHKGVEGNTRLACRRAMWLGAMVPEATQSLRVAR
ncbi:unnamed protein product [Prunus armeniaca]